MDAPTRYPPHLRALPPALLAQLSPEDRAELAALHTTQQRGLWAVRSGTLPDEALPDFLRPFGRAVAFFYLNLPDAFGAAEAEATGARFGLDAAAVADALQAFQRAEHIGADGRGGFVRLGASGVPF